ncbi:MAG: DUF3526 domain-containing protein [Pseudomonadota bacterium]
MSAASPIARELRFLLHQPFALSLIMAAAFLSAFAVWSGLSESKRQDLIIERLLVADTEDRAAAIAKESDYGGAAYYAFHLTYDPPSDLAFAAMGERDVFPWKHRIRMLALEGQIYDSDAANAELAQSGQFDFAFVVSILAPLFLIVLLHDQRASERMSGRHDLLIATAGGDGQPWRARAAVRVGLFSLALLAPFFIGAVIAGVGVISVFLVCAIVLGQVLFWTLVCLWASARSITGPAIASGLLAFWILTTFVIPAVGDAVIENAIPAPEGGDIMLTQREAVNDAWDLPKEATMAPFIARHPEWTDYATIERPFEWKWYYAFQQVGDQTVEEISKQRRDAVADRDRAAGWVALLSPSALTQRGLTRLAETDVRAALEYQEAVRDFHASLRTFFYPLLFKGEDYSQTILDEAPKYDPETADG